MNSLSKLCYSYVLLCIFIEMGMIFTIITLKSIFLIILICSSLDSFLFYSYLHFNKKREGVI